MDFILHANGVCRVNPELARLIVNKYILVSPKIIIIVANWVGVPLIFVYVISMFAIPAYQAQCDWAQIQNVWDRWASLNVGMLAFISSLIAFNISRHNADQQRKREFIAARSFLPESLSELTDYCRASMAVFAKAWPRVNDPSDTCDTPLDSSIPELPGGYRNVFRECIKLADPPVADHLSRILTLLQIHHSRMESLFEGFRSKSTVVTPHTIMSHFFDISQVHALINKVFNFARGLEPLDTKDLVWDDYYTPFFVNKIMIEQYDGLQGFIEEAINRGD